MGENVEASRNTRNAEGLTRSGRVDIRQARLALEWCVDKSDPMAQEIQSLSRDVINAGKGRDYRGITAFFEELLTAREINIRSIGFKTSEAGGCGKDWPIVDMSAFKHHMRWLKIRPAIMGSVIWGW